MDTTFPTSEPNELTDETVDRPVGGEQPACLGELSAVADGLAELQFVSAATKPEDVLSTLRQCFENLVDADRFTYENRIITVLGRLEAANVKSVPKGQVRKLAKDIWKHAQHRKEQARETERAASEQARFAGEHSWKRDLTYRGNELAATLTNVVTILRRHPAWDAVLGFNERTQRIEYLNAPPWRAAEADSWKRRPFEDVDAAKICMWFEQSEFGLLLAPKGDVLWSAIDVVTRDRPFDPVQDYLNGLEWDGKERLSMMAFTHLGAVAANGGEDAARDGYVSTVIRKSMIGAVARALDPGCKMDTVTILQGPQGVGKSRALRILFGDEYFVDHLPDVQSKDAAMLLSGNWCIEVAELAGMSRADANALKQFITTPVDVFRPPYGRVTARFPRRSVFWGTTNDSEYLKDPTGGRRFLPIEVGKPNLEALKCDRDRLWAEAVRAYKSGEPWHLEDEEVIAQATKEQAQRLVTDAWHTIIANYVAANAIQVGKERRVTLDAVLEHGIKKSPDHWSQSDKIRVAAVLKALNFVQKQRRVKGERVWFYVRDVEVGP